MHVSRACAYLKCGTNYSCGFLTNSNSTKKSLKFDFSAPCFSNHQRAFDNASKLINVKRRESILVSRAWSECTLKGPVENNSATYVSQRQFPTFFLTMHLNSLACFDFDLFYLQWIPDLKRYIIWSHTVRKTLHFVKPRLTRQTSGLIFVSERTLEEIKEKKKKKKLASGTNAWRTRLQTWWNRPPDLRLFFK